MKLFPILIAALVLNPFTVNARPHDAQYTISVIPSKMQILLMRDMEPVTACRSTVPERDQVL
jgi:hypothetical protein